MSQIKFFYSKYIEPTKFMAFIKEHPKKIALILIVLIFGIFFFKNVETKIEVGRLESGNIEEIVSVSGSVAPNQESSLAFEKSGRIQSINVKVGDKVYTGQVLASLSGNTDYAGVLNSQAQLDSAEANLQDAKNGASDTDLAVRQVSVDTAQSNLNSDYNSVSDTIRSVNTNLTDILGNQIGNLFTLNSSSYRLSFNSCNQSLQSQIEKDRGILDTKIVTLNNLATSFSMSSPDIDSQIDQAGAQVYNTTISVSNMLDDIHKLITSSCHIADSGLDKYRSSVSSARNSISNTLSNINTLKSKLLSDRNALSSANSLLAQTKAGNSPEKIKSLEALVGQAKANLLSAQSINAKNFIIAPFDGTVTIVNINLGEISSPNTPAIKVISLNNLELKIKLSEVDLVKVKAGNKAKVYLDTYGNSVVFPGVVSEVDPAATNEGNVSTYYAKIDFTSTDERIRSGMNGSADIVTAQKDNANYILAKYIKVDGTNTTVKVIKDINKLKDTTSNTDDKNIEIRNVILGMRSTDGKIEIISGLSGSDNLYPIGSEILSNKISTK
ncbi:MAG: HlyD family secretion protein [Patescibacteria group bacterium]|nr:HlyD family secretion protein [Patescibacteria group bacterium]